MAPGRKASTARPAAPTGRATRVVDALTELGFSQYEAKTYAGLVGREPMTGYAVAKETGVPQPKVYETLGKLAERNAVLQVGSTPATFVAVPPARLFAGMDTDFRQRIAAAELEVSKLQQHGSDAPAMRPFHEADSWLGIAQAATALISTATRRLYVSGHRAHLEPLGDAIQEADERDVQIDVLCFGEPPFTVRNGSVVRHRSTEHIIYPHHQARHLAVTSDQAGSLWALAPGGEDWQGIWANDDELLCGLVKGFIRHDLFVGRVYNDFGPQMRERYGAGLEGLFRPTPPAHLIPSFSALDEPAADGTRNRRRARGA